MNMNFFDEGKTICVCCQERVCNNDIQVICGDIGVCKICSTKLMPVAKDSPFEGTPDVDYVLSAYYYNKAIKRLTHRYKFSCENMIGNLFAAMLYERIKEVPVFSDFDFIVAMPLSRKRLKERSFNQAEVIAQRLSEYMGIPHISCVFRSKHTLAQSTLRAHERVKNIANAFVADKTKVRGKRILLVDDIFTTGSTMNSCAKELKENGALSVVGITFAKVYR